VVVAAVVVVVGAGVSSATGETVGFGVGAPVVVEVVGAGVSGATGLAVGSGVGLSVQRPLPHFGRRPLPLPVAGAPPRTGLLSLASTTGVPFGWARASPFFRVNAAGAESSKSSRKSTPSSKLSFFPPMLMIVFVSSTIKILSPTLKPFVVAT
jgi:hypothetical protein